MYTTQSSLICKKRISNFIFNHCTCVVQRILRVLRTVLDCVGSLCSALAVVIGDGHFRNVVVHELGNVLGSHAASGQHHDYSRLAGVHVLLGRITQRHIVGEHRYGEYKRID